MAYLDYTGLQRFKEKLDTELSVLNNAVNNLGIIDLETLTWERGRIGTTGSNANSNYDIRTKLFPINPTTRVLSCTFNFPAAVSVDYYYINIYEFSANSTSNFIQSHQIKSNETAEITLDNSATYLRLCIRAYPTSTTTLELTDYKYVDLYYAKESVGAIAQYEVQKTLDPLKPNAVAGLYGKTPDIIKSGTDFTVVIKSYPRAIWNDDGAVSTDNKDLSITLENANTLFYNPAADTFLTSVISGIPSLPADCIPLLSNFNGALYGQWSQFYYDSDLERAINDDPPLYYSEHLSTKIATIQEKSMALGENSGRFFFVTDYHISQNTRVSPSLVHYIGNKCGIRKMVFGGDAIQSYNTAAKGYAGLCSFIDDFSTVQENQEAYYITGNHEQNNPSNSESYRDRQVSVGAIYRLFFDQMTAAVYINDSANSFYYDDPSAKIRYYCIGCEIDAVISDDTVAKVSASLLTVPEGYAVFIISHRAFTSGSLDTDFSDILAACKDMNDGTGDFSGHARTFIGAISGHIHYDLYAIYDGRFPVIATTCDAYQAINESHDYEEISAARQPGTVYEQAFDVVQLDVSSKRIYLTRIGYGDDRTFSFGDGASLIT